MCSVPDAVYGRCQLSFDELSDLFSVFSKICEPEDKARVAFCMYDLDRDCKLDKTDIGNVVLRFVFDMPPLLDKTWAKVEPPHAKVDPPCAKMGPTHGGSTFAQGGSTWAILELSWATFGAIGALRGSTWAILKLSWTTLGLYVGHLGGHAGTRPLHVQHLVELWVSFLAHPLRRLLAGEWTGHRACVNLFSCQSVLPRSGATLERSGTAIGRNRLSTTS